MVPRKKPNYLWVRETFNNVAPAHSPTPNLDDALGTFKTQYGISLNLPDFTIWRLRIKISIHISSVAVLANNAVHFAAFVDSLETSPTISSLTKPFAHKYLMWDNLYLTDTVMQSGETAAAVNVVYKEYDIKSHRRLENIEDTLWFSLTELGNTNIVDYAYTWSLLLRER